jgi:hypothetical protein
VPACGWNSSAAAAAVEPRCQRCVSDYIRDGSHPGEPTTESRQWNVSATQPDMAAARLALLASVYNPERLCTPSSNSIVKSFAYNIPLRSRCYLVSGLAFPSSLCNERAVVRTHPTFQANHTSVHFPTLSAIYRVASRFQKAAVPKMRVINATLAQTSLHLPFLILSSEPWLRSSGCAESE